MIVDRINEYLSSKETKLDENLRYEIEKLSGSVFKRQFMTDEKPLEAGKIRLSACGKCVRQQAYTFHAFEKKGKEMDSRAKIIFWTGDLSENTIVGLAKLAGVPLLCTGLQQLPVKLPLGESVIEGHPDGMLLHNKELFLVEIKSMSSFSFKRFEDGYVDPSYIAQMNAYMECLGLKRCIMVALNKDNGIMQERLIEKDEAVITKIRETLKAVIDSQPNDLPEAPEEYDKDAKGLYPWNCLYCAYWGHCRENAEKVLVRNSYKLKEKETTDE